MIGQIKSVLLAATVAFTAVAIAPATAQNYGSMAKKAAGVEKLNIVETAAANGNFKTLLAAATAAGLADTLATGGPFTLFAPTDEAFKKLPPGTVESLLANPDQLKQILLYHVVEGPVKSDAVVKLTSAKTLQGGSVTVAVVDGKVKIDNATVTKADIEASNGIIHVIDTVILPKAEEKAEGKSIVETAVAAGSFKTLAAALTAAGLVETLSGEGPYTVFAPTDEAFKKIDPATLASLLLPQNKDKLTAILLNHVVEGKVTSADVVKLTSAKTVGGGSLPISVVDGKVKVGASTVQTADVAANNGVIHVIDTVLIPE